MTKRAARSIQKSQIQHVIITGDRAPSDRRESIQKNSREMAMASRALFAVLVAVGGSAALNVPLLRVPSRKSFFVSRIPIQAKRCTSKLQYRFSPDDDNVSPVCVDFSLIAASTLGTMAATLASKQTSQIYALSIIGAALPLLFAVLDPMATYKVGASIVIFAQRLNAAVNRLKQGVKSRCIAAWTSIPDRGAASNATAKTNPVVAWHNSRRRGKETQQTKPEGSEVYLSKIHRQGGLAAMSR